MKFLIILTIVALACPLFAQEIEEKKLEKRGLLSLGTAGLGYGGHGIGHAYSAPVVRVATGHVGGHGLLGGLSAGHGRISGHGF